MIRKVGRLEFNEIYEIKKTVEKFYKLLSEGKEAEATKAIVELASSPNYFVREEIGSYLPKLEDQKIIHKKMKKLLEHKVYGVRASALIYFAKIYHDKPTDIIKIINKIYADVPWETENIINDLWLKYPKDMKNEMQHWIKSDDHEKKILAFQGIEKLAERDPSFVMEFLDSSIDDEDVEVQKKITHILTQIARARPAEAYPYIREWLSQGDESRMKTLWVTMKKLANIISQKYRKNISSNFVSLTQQTILDWANDPNDIVAKLGKKLEKIIR